MLTRLDRRQAQTRVDAAGRPGLALARALSTVLSPPVTGAATLLVAAFTSAGIWRAVAWSIVGLVLACAVPVAFVLVLVRTGHVTDLHLGKRTDRLRPLAVSAGSVGSLVALEVGGGAPPEVVRVSVAYLLLLAVLGTVTFAWQISFHGATASLLAVAGLAHSGIGIGTPTLIMAAGVCWARVRLGRHTVPEVVAGAAAGVVAALVATV